MDEQLHCRQKTNKQNFEERVRKPRVHAYILTRINGWNINKRKKENYAFLSNRKKYTNPKCYVTEALGVSALTGGAFAKDGYIFHLGANLFLICLWENIS